MAGLAVIHDEEPPKIRELSFATEGPQRFHDLMHPIWRCHDRRLHLARAWEFRWKPELRRLTLCRIGHHQLGKTWMRPIIEIMEDGEYVFGEWRFAFTCRDCGAEPPLATPEEDTR
jgi:hypothetical protein